MLAAREQKSRQVGARGLHVVAGLLLSACASHSVRTDTPPRMVTLRGTVFDSLALMPLRGARITLAALDTVTAMTDTNGVFEVSVMSGARRVAITHPRFDSLHVVVPARTLDVPAQPVASAKLWTMSRRTVTRILCGDSAKSDDAAIVGIVRDAVTQRGIDSASVIVKWVNLTLSLQRGRFAGATETHVSRTTSDGWYVACGVPANGTLVLWAEHAGALSGAVPLTLEGSAIRADLSVDPAARRSVGSIDLEPDSSGASLFPTATGNTRYRVLVVDPGGKPVSNARVRLLGKRTLRTNDAGAVMLDSVARGTQTIEVLGIGFQPQRRVIDIGPRREPADTFVLASLGTLLDTMRVTASRNGLGFDGRRNSGIGQFITAADIERENPPRTTQLLRNREGLRFTYDRHGFPYIEVTTIYPGCKPLVFLDGFPASPMPTAPGEAAMDWLVHPDEIGGVEIYTTAAKIPQEFARFGRGSCGAVAFWTRQALGLPKSEILKP